MEEDQKFDYFCIEIYYGLNAKKFFKLSFFEYQKMIMPYIQYNNETYSGVISNYFEIQSFIASFSKYNFFTSDVRTLTKKIGCNKNN